MFFQNILIFLKFRMILFPISVFPSFYPRGYYFFSILAPSP